jgi:protein-disulfide isomerase
MKLRLLLTLVAAAALATPGATHSQAPGAAQQDWSRTVVATPEGGFRIGNPDAPVKLVEYASLTCPHCAEFAVHSKGSLIANHVRSGRVSFEFRNFVLNGIDAAASLLARCASPAEFFPLTERMFETQQDWTDRIRALSEAEKQRIMALPPAEAYAQVVQAGGLIDLAGRHGVTAERGRQCLGDQAGVQQLERLAQAAEALGVQGTPTFFLNGRKLDVNTWAQIEPLLAG